jgi:ABC-2 type transport system permease protein
MAGLLGIYREQFKVELAIKMQYRIATVLNMLQMAVEPIVYLVVWRAVTAAQGGSIEGFSASDFATYYLIFTFQRQWVAATGMWGIMWRIREGYMNNLLMRPLNPIHLDIAENLSYKLFSAVALIPVLIALGVVFQAAFNPPLWALIAFVPATILAMIGFWTTRLEGVNQAFFICQTFFGGTLAPLALLPDGLRLIADFLPFKWMLSFPIELLMGRVLPNDALIGMGIQVLWLVICTVGFLLGWRAGLRHYGAVGG